MTNRAFAVKDNRRLLLLVSRIESLFTVRIQVSAARSSVESSGRSEWVITVSGKTSDCCNKAQSYIEAICLPETTVAVCCSAACVQVLFSDSLGLRDAIERDLAVFLEPTSSGVSVQGSKYCVDSAVAKISTTIETMNNDLPGSSHHSPPRHGQADQLQALLQLTASNPASVDQLPNSVRDAILRELKDYAEQQRREQLQQQQQLQQHLIGRDGTNHPQMLYQQRKIDQFVPLGYLRHEVQAVLDSLGSGASDNDILARLVMTHPSRDRSITSIPSSTLPQRTSPTGENHQTIPPGQSLIREGLRPIVVDGSNVAMRHGGGQVFSCRGILLAVQWFQKRGHNKITVFVPQWRKESSKPDSPIIDQEILLQLERDGLINFTPSRRIREKKIVCYDDRFIVRLAAETGGVIVSNDNFRDLVDEDSSWREAIEKRLLMFTFADDLFMPPTDPLGRSGPHLDVFLRFDGGAKMPSRDNAGERSVPQDRQLCPYAERCTFGPKCRFYHPEREQRMREREAAERTAKSVSPPSPSPLKSRGEPNDLDLSGRICQLSLIHHSPTKVPARVIGHPSLTKANSGSSIHDRDYQYQPIPPSSRSMDSIPSFKHEHQHPMTFPLQYHQQQTVQTREDHMRISPSTRSASSDRLVGRGGGGGYLPYPPSAHMADRHYYNPYHHPHGQPFPHATRPHPIPGQDIRHAGPPHLCPPTSSYSPSVDPNIISMVQYKHPDSNPLPQRCPPTSLPTRPHSARMHMPAADYSRESPLSISDHHQSFPGSDGLAFRGQSHHIHNGSN